MGYVTLQQENASVSLNMKENFVKRKHVYVRITVHVVIKVNVFALLNFTGKIVKLKDVNEIVMVLNINMKKEETA
jgi:hypothetical protein